MNEALGGEINVHLEYYVNNYAMSFVYLTVLILWHILSFSVHMDKREEFHLQSGSSFLSEELVTILWGSLLVGLLVY